VRFLKLLVQATQAGATALSALWTFPSILLSAFLVAWGAEAAQFLISQGLALALLAWLQTLPEFAVEAVIAWDAGRDPARTHLAIANLTGAIRLLLGLGWPMIYFVFAWYARRSPGSTGGGGWPAIQLEREHAVEVIGLLPALLYFIVIIIKQTMPQDKPASLSEQEYAEIVAFLLKSNKYPAGEQPLEPNPAALKGIGFKRP